MFFSTKNNDLFEKEQYYSFIRNKKFHRQNGPAEIWSDGSKCYSILGKVHRTDGPAMEWDNGEKDYVVNGEHFSKEEFEERFLNNDLW